MSSIDLAALTLTDEQLGGLTFEQAQARLEQIVGLLETGEPALEEALTLYQQGLRLRDVCRGKLEGAEAILERLVDLPDGGLRIEEAPDGV